MRTIQNAIKLAVPFYLFIYLFIYLLTICNKTLKTYFSIVKIYAIGGLQEWSLHC